RAVVVRHAGRGDVAFAVLARLPGDGDEVAGVHELRFGRRRDLHGALFDDADVIDPGRLTIRLAAVGGLEPARTHDRIVASRCSENQRQGESCHRITEHRTRLLVGPARLEAFLHAVRRTVHDPTYCSRRTTAPRAGRYLATPLFHCS